MSISKITTEKGLEEALKDWLKVQPDCYFFKAVGGPYQAAGIPDIIVCWHGKFAAIELKTPGRLKRGFKPKSQTEILQVRHIENIDRAGGLAGVFDNLDTIKDWLNSFLTISN